MNTLQFFLAGAILAAAVALQGAIGFGAGLFAVPLIVWTGVELPSVIAALSAAVTLQVALGCWQYRSHIPWRTTFQIALWRILGLPIGIATLTVLAGAGRDRAKQVIGVTLLAIIITQYLAKVKPRSHVHPAWIPLAGVTSGFLAGAFGMGAPPVVLWLMAHDWPAKQVRAFLWSTFLLILPVNFAMLCWTFGWTVVAAFVLGLAYAPLVLLASAAGARLGDRLDRRRLQVVAFGFLAVIAIASIVGPLL
jgi:uncharacterized membrane protein YfcA